MAVKIKLMRLGKMRSPQYRIVVADARTRRNGRSIESIGKYRPKEDPSYIEVDSGRAQYWLSVGAQPTEPVEAILKLTGDWQRFKGLPPPEELRMPKARVDRRAAFEDATRLAGAEKDAAGSAGAPRKRAAKKAAPAAGPAAGGPAPAAPAAAAAAVVTSPPATSPEENPPADTSVTTEAQARPDAAASETATAQDTAAPGDSAADATAADTRAADATAADTTADSGGES